MHVDFEFTKDWGLIEKGTVKSLDKAFARSLQDMDKVGKIIGVTMSQKDKEIIEDAKKVIQKEVDNKVAAMKKENEALRKENAELKKAMPPPRNKADKKAASRVTK